MKSFGTVVRALAAVATVALITACENPVSSGTHVRPNGVEVLRGSSTLARIQLVTGQPPVITGELAVTAGQQTEPLAVRFLAPDGTVITPPSGYYLEVAEVNPAIARWEHAAGEFGGRLVGVAAGSTTFHFKWMHGAVGRGHDDSAGPLVLPVTVN